QIHAPNTHTQTNQHNTHINQQHARNTHTSTNTHHTSPRTTAASRGPAPHKRANKSQLVILGSCAVYLPLCLSALDSIRIHDATWRAARMRNGQETTTQRSLGPATHTAIQPYSQRAAKHKK